MTMSDVKDDPKDVLVFLNSLGFVGITAPQLKSFIKELKFYRKIKQKQQQEWKNQMKKKIYVKHQGSFEAILQEQVQKDEWKRWQHSPSSREDSLMRIQIKYSSKDTENKSPKRTHCRISKPVDDAKEKPKSCASKHSQMSHPETDICKEFLDLKLSEDVKSKRVISNDEKTATRKRPYSAPTATERRSRSRAKKATSDTERTVDTRKSSKSSRDRSKSKSFIRPWKLQPENQQPLTCRKSDPVSLYHKYQQGWKQLSLPGEERHSKVRWGVREKMLGSDPNPRPTTWKSASCSTLRKR